MTTTVLVHGAFRGAWSWAPTVHEMRRRGHRVVAVDLCNAGERYRVDHPPVGLAAVAADLHRQVSEVGGAVRLVGHSQGALVVRALLAGPVDEVVAVGYLDGAVPEVGECAAALSGFPAPPRDLVVQPPPPDEVLDPVTRAEVQRRTRPQHAAMAADPVGPLVTTVPTSWAFCTGTPATYPAATVRARLDAVGVTYRWIAAPHDAPLTHPGPVTEWLESVR